MEIDVVNLVGLGFVKLWLLLSVAIFLLSRSRNTSAATLHALLLLVLFSVAISLLLVEQMPGLHLHILPSDFIADLHWSYHHDSASRIFVLIGSGYLACMIYLWSRRLLQIRQAFYALKKARPLAIDPHQKMVSQLCSYLAIKRVVRLRYSDHIATPLTLGTFRPWILLPRESLLWDEHRLRRFLLHELAHIARFDWFIKQFAYCVVAIFWIVPPAWNALRKLEWLAELACDDIVIDSEGRRSDYAHDLLDMMANQPVAGAIGLTESLNHYDRITAVLDGGRIRHKNPLKFWLHALVFFFVLSGVAGFKLLPKIQVNTPEYYVFQPLVVLPEINDVSRRAVRDEELFSTDQDIDLGRPERWFAHPLPVNDPAPEPTPVVTFNRDWLEEAEAIKLDSIQPLVKTLPEYPRKALRRAREGVVELTFSVLPNGTTSQIEIIRAEPPNIFDKTAIDAVRQYRYAPRERTLHGLNEVFEFRLIEDAP